MNASASPTAGDELPTLRLDPISRKTLSLFADASGDNNAVHIDTHAARDAGYDDVFAHGMLSMAYLGRLLTNWVDQATIRSLTARFVAITPVNARPTCTGTVVEVRTEGEEVHATLDLCLTLEDGTESIRGSAVVALDTSRGMK